MHCQISISNMLLKNIYTGTISQQIRTKAYGKFWTGQSKSWLEIINF